MIILKHLLVYYFIQSIIKESIDEIIIDFIIRCVKGIYRNKFIYINLINDGEIIGSDPTDPQVTLCLQKVGVSPK